MSNILFTFFDVETTGFDPVRNELITMCLIITDLSGKELGRINLKSRPTGIYHSFEIFAKTLNVNLNNPKEYAAAKKMYKGNWIDAQKAHGIPIEVAREFPTPDEFCNELMNFLAPINPRYFHIYWIYHANGKFDPGFLYFQFHKLDRHWEITPYLNLDGDHFISTIDYAKEILSVEKHSLDFLADYFGIPLTHHEAESDTEACMKIFFRLRELKYRNPNHLSIG